MNSPWLDSSTVAGTYSSKSLSFARLNCETHQNEKCWNFVVPFFPPPPPPPPPPLSPLSSPPSPPPLFFYLFFFFLLCYFVLLSLFFFAPFFPPPPPFICVSGHLHFASTVISGLINYMCSFIKSKVGYVRPALLQWPPPNSLRKPEL